jgi:hypothetical protein
MSFLKIVAAVILICAIVFVATFLFYPQLLSPISTVLPYSFTSPATIINQTVSSNLYTGQEANLTSFNLTISKTIPLSDAGNNQGQQDVQFSEYEMIRGDSKASSYNGVYTPINFSISGYYYKLSNNYTDYIPNFVGKKVYFEELLTNNSKMLIPYFVTGESASNSTHFINYTFTLDSETIVPVSVYNLSNVPIARATIGIYYNKTEIILAANQ